MPLLPTIRRAFSLLCLLALSTAACGADPADPEKEVLELCKSGKLFDRAQYKTVRAAFTRLFEKNHEADLQVAYAEDQARFGEWLDAHADVKQAFYTAVDDRHDQVAGALKLFKGIWKKSPDNLAKYANLAIAVAVTWDDERNVYDYRHHQVRAHSTMPAGLLDAAGNFDYMVANEKVTEGRLKFLPWEFLVFVVDHRTPLPEREWAQRYYQRSRGRVSSWHQDIAYDMNMLKGEQDPASGLKPKLTGKDYTLANLKAYGGVCAHQADFASRVAKSVGIPAVFCYGRSAYRGLHAWWMFVQVQSASADQLRFNLVSDGRIAGFIKDQLYTGNVRDPQTGREMLDRDMERRLWEVGHDPAAKRHADLIMRAYALLANSGTEFDLAARASFLDRCLKLAPQHEEAWLELAHLAEEDKVPEKTRSILLGYLGSLNRTFSSYPDFAARLLDELVKIQPDTSERIKVYEQAVSAFEKAGRPDLTCAARLKITDLLAEQKKWQTAGQGLAYTIRKFPTEGRYLGQMTKKFQEVAEGYTDGPPTLAKIYIELIPAMLLYYGKEGSQHCTALFHEAEEYLDSKKLTRQLKALRDRTEQAKSTLRNR
jgi:hypothetical protein